MEQCHAVAQRDLPRDIRLCSFNATDATLISHQRVHLMATWPGRVLGRRQGRKSKAMGLTVHHQGCRRRQCLRISKSDASMQAMHKPKIKLTGKSTATQSLAVDLSLSEATIRRSSQIEADAFPNTECSVAPYLKIPRSLEYALSPCMPYIIRLILASLTL